MTTTLSTRTAQLVAALCLTALAGLGIAESAAASHTGPTSSVEAGVCRNCN